MYNQAGVAELPEGSGPFITVADAQDMTAWRVSEERAAALADRERRVGKALTETACTLPPPAP